jgi:hypothetical protein
MTLEAEEFIRRFLLHVLPEGFQRSVLGQWRFREKQPQQRHPLFRPRQTDLDMFGETAEHCSVDHVQSVRGRYYKRRRHETEFYARQASTLLGNNACRSGNDRSPTLKVFFAFSRGRRGAQRALNSGSCLLLRIGLGLGKATPG